ncbi:sacsin N-terminal ATP-binding-like domain-containing protein [Rhodococcus xishaensis]|uniref:ATP-binding protein n=1 Tax=Rhodococcus xishaensis TaxID=2487364 RepID=A0A3S3B1C0_9NOCA|nr:ATP-binding protein [Rhodococcus xishaensis]RVW00821.1 ATP-binding protein [Rhodococcus xishaensis]
MTDPFDTAALREGTLLAWRGSPTRLREDVAAEADLVRAGYRDRVLTELAQNAADAAVAAGVPGKLRVQLLADGLSIANTGAPLDREGVHALVALRASGKSTGVGRFGVGFTSVLAVSDDIELRSSSGSLAFSSERTRIELASAGLEVPAAGAPVLRMAWATDERPPGGFDSEVVLRLRPDVNVDVLLARFAAEAVDLLLELPALESIEIDGARLRRTERDLGGGLTEVTIGPNTWWQYVTKPARWLVPVVDGRVQPVNGDVLRAPTRSDEEVSIPALLIADVPMQPDRRRILPGTGLTDLALGYADFVAALPSDQRPDLVPLPGFARSEVDAVLREALLRELRTQSWVPAAGADAGDLAPARATIVSELTPELAEVLADVVPDLVDPQLCGSRHASALAAVDVHRIGLARIAELLSGHDREPLWWHALYTALEPIVVDAIAVEELAAVPVPLADGRTVTGPRTAVTGTDLGHALGDAGSALDWVRLVHPDAAHPLLNRLGAERATAGDLLSDPALKARIEEIDYDDPAAATELATVVLALVGLAGPEARPAWLGELPLPDADGELVPADELLLPGAPLADVLVEESPFGTVDSDLVARVGEESLRALGVGWGFPVLWAELPTGPEHDLDDEEAWWNTLDDDPETLVAVRDLDLVDPACWPRALTLLADNPETAATLTDRDGYTAWWLRRHARIDGRPLAVLRAPADDTFAGLLDVFDHPAAPALASALAPAVVDDTELAGVLLDRLADPTRTVTPDVVTRTHRLLGAAAATHVLDLDELVLPTRVRSLAGTVADPEDALVLDRAHLGGVIPPERIVLGAFDTAAALADLLDLPLASTAIDAEILGDGEVSSWDREPGAVLACAALGMPLPSGSVVVHDDLVVRTRGAVEGDVAVPWWVDDERRTHLRRWRVEEAP